MREKNKKFLVVLLLSVGSPQADMIRNMDQEDETALEAMAAMGGIRVLNRNQKRRVDELVKAGLAQVDPSRPSHYLITDLGREVLGLAPPEEDTRE